MSMWTYLQLDFKFGLFRQDMMLPNCSIIDFLFCLLDFVTMVTSSLNPLPLWLDGNIQHLDNLSLVSLRALYSNITIYLYAVVSHCFSHQQIDQCVPVMLGYRNMYGSGLCPLLCISLRISGFLRRSLSVSFGVKYVGTLCTQLLTLIWYDLTM
uniref:Putative ovule protein n=1 Tax=Solanum chacoense TaxID=4108 RepID=A0A0V0HRW5_SOLCH